MTKLLVSLWTGLFVGLLSLPAQSTFGTILGTVTDKSGAVVPGVKVVVTNLGENVARETVTDSLGNYEVPNLKAGTYSVAAQAAGFREFTVHEVLLEARQTVRVNVLLEVGQIAEKVTVMAAANVISTETQTIAASFDSREVLSLPANFRTPDIPPKTLGKAGYLRT